MTIKQQGGIFGRNPTFNDVTVNDITVDTLSSPAVDLQSNGVADFKKYISITDTNVRINMLETDTTDLNAQIKNQAGIFEIKTISDNLASGTTRLQIDHTNALAQVNCSMTMKRGRGRLLCLMLLLRAIMLVGHSTVTTQKLVIVF